MTNCYLFRFSSTDRLKLELILQAPYNEACGHACVAMLGGVTLARVFEMARSERRLGTSHALTLLRQLGREVTDWGYLIEAFGSNALGGLVQKHRTLMCSVYSCLDPQYAHMVVIHEKQLYDPWAGMNPIWSWDRYIGSCHPVEAVK